MPLLKFSDCFDALKRLVLQGAIASLDLKHPVDPSGEQIDWTSIGVVGGVRNELIIEADLEGGSQGVALVGFEDLLQACVRQSPRPIADDDA